VVIEWLRKTVESLSISIRLCKMLCGHCQPWAGDYIDRGIQRALNDEKLDVLLIDPTTKILHPGYNYGFIGGACGLISEVRWYFRGFPLLEAG
jgi:hypothetical protein